MQKIDMSEIKATSNELNKKIYEWLALHIINNSIHYSLR